MNYENGTFTDAEKAALAYAEVLTLDAGSIPEDLFERLKSHYSEGEILEITAMAGLFNYFNRVAEALQIEPTKPGEGIE